MSRRQGSGNALEDGFTTVARRPCCAGPGDIRSMSDADRAESWHEDTRGWGDERLSRVLSRTHERHPNIPVRIDDEDHD